MGGGDYVKMFDVEIEECDVIHHVLSPTFQGLLVKKIRPLTLIVRVCKGGFRKCSKIIYFYFDKF